MGLFEPGTGSADGVFVKEDERSVLIFQKVVIPILKVVKKPSTDPKFDDQYIVETVLPGSEEPRVLGFSANSVPNRAAGLEAICQMQDAGTYNPIFVRLVRDGKATLLVEVDESEAAPAEA